MNKWIIITSILLILGIGAAIIGYFFVYNKPHKNYEKAKAEYRLDSESLFSQYNTNRKDAEHTYNGKVIEVTGTVSSVETPDSLTIVVFAISEGLFGDEGIRFTVLNNYREAALALEKDERVTIKGYCTGYNDTDVILEKCSIITQDSNL